MAHDDHDYATPFEGPEKLLEIWFAPSPAHLPQESQAVDRKSGLLKVPRPVWEEMLDIVKCKILSVIHGTTMDAYLLSESSLFVSPHRLILKTCGTTLNLLGLPRILEIARDHASLPSVHRCFYSRKSFMFPERQLGPHREWKDEIRFLDAIFPCGAAYTVGKENGDHWLLYLTSPMTCNGESIPASPETPVFLLPGGGADAGCTAIDTPSAAEVADDSLPVPPDYTIEILMSDLSAKARAPFFTSDPEDGSISPSEHAHELSSSLGISEIFPPHLTTLDAYSFTPCGYSANALLQYGGDGQDQPSGEGYYTIHVTPEADWSYASFECNVPLSTCASSKTTAAPDLKTLVRRVVDIFQPGRLSLTLFIPSAENQSEEDESDTAVETAQRAFKSALMSLPQWTGPTSPAGNGYSRFAGSSYRRTDKINYEFGGYDLAFASFELRK